MLMILADTLWNTKRKATYQNTKWVLFHESYSRWQKSDIGHQSNANLL